MKKELDYALLDSDAHMSEPHNLWTERVDRRYLDDAPCVVDEYKGKKGKFLVFEDKALKLAGFDEKGTSIHMGRPGGWDPAERLKDMAIDGIAAAVLYPTIALWLFSSEKAGAQEACFRVYNDWLAEFCSHAPQRLAGVALISLFDIDNGIKELERCRKLGLKACSIWAQPPSDRPAYATAAYDRFWTKAQELNMPISLHISTGGSGIKRFAPENEGNWGLQYTKMVMHQEYIQDSVLQLTFSGVFERFPELKVVCVEADMGWMPPLMSRADKYYASRIRRGHDLQLKKLPSEYMRSNVWLTFIDDSFGLENYRTGDLVNQIMWSTDYPHPACFFPNSVDVFKRDFQGVPDEDKQKITHDNVAKLYGFDKNISLKGMSS